MNVLFESSLGKSLKNTMAEAICSGEIAPSSIMEVSIRSLQTEDDIESDLGTLLKPDVDRIVILAKPSPFGQGNETVFDDNVRKGLELVASQFSIAHEDELLQGIREQIQRKLFPLLPGGPEALTLKRYKMAIYKEGGHFQFHRDSLHADNHQATLLLEVRSAHKGGKFVIDHYGDGTEKIKGKSEYGHETEYNAIFEISFDEAGSVSTPLKWLAFYTDALHKVERVTSGTRIAIQYDVYIDTEMPLAIKNFQENPNIKVHERNDDDDDDDDDDDNDDDDDDKDNGHASSEKHYEENEDDSDDVDDKDNGHASSEKHYEENEDDSEDDDDNDDEGDSNEDTDEMVWEKGEENMHVYLDDISSVFRRYRFPCVSNIAVQKVLKELDKLIAENGTKNVAIPLFHRYSSASIQREFLKGPDRLLFDAIVKEKKYVLGLSPIMITVESEEGGYFNEKSYSITFTDPMTVSYHWDAETKDILLKPIKNDHELNSRDCMYAVSKREEFWKILESSYKEWVGNEGEEALHKYFLGVIVVGPK